MVASILTPTPVPRLFLAHELQGVDCSEAGATLESLPIREGYWRAALDLSFSRECFNEVRYQPTDPSISQTPGVLVRARFY